MDIERIIGFDALWDSMMKCKRGVMWKDSVAGFCLDSIRQVSKLCDQLHDGTYKERPHKYFTISYPKERSIMSIIYRLTKTGKVILSIDPNRVKAVRKKLARMVKKAKAGGDTREKVDQSYICWRSHAQHGNSWGLVRRMDNYYNGLWRAGND